MLCLCGVLALVGVATIHTSPRQMEKICYKRYLDYMILPYILSTYFYINEIYGTFCEVLIFTGVILVLKFFC